MLEMIGVKAGYGDRIILNGVSLSIATGDHVSLIGHNGAGKSTILKAVTGQIPTVGGEIKFLGKRINGLTPEVLVRHGVVQVPAGRRVFQQLTVRQNLEMGAYTRSDKDGISLDLESMMSQFPTLARKASDKAGSLSGGEQQVLAVARALMARPKLLFVDEPSLGLSPLMVDEVFNFLAKMTAGGMTLVLAEQNVRKALAITTRAIVLSQGAIVGQMASDALLSDESFRRAYLGAE
jgi:branched-chain amino acid transport system ATP-binding protein